MGRVARVHPVVAFYVLAFAISWVGYGPLLARRWGVAGFASEWWLGCLLLPGVGPAIAAGVASYWAGERDGLAQLRRGFCRRVGVRWWGVAVLLPPAMLLAAHGLSRCFGPGAGAGNVGRRVLTAAVVSVAANPWEEVGWRGFALPRLQARYGFTMAAFVVGVLWAVWHVPLFLLPGSGMETHDFLPWGVGIVARSFVLAWLFDRTRGSLAAVSVFHVGMNVFGAWFAVVFGVEAAWSLAVVDVGVIAGLFVKYGREMGADFKEVE